MRSLERPVYEPGTLLTERHLGADQKDLVRRLRNSNRYGHGSGVVCGLQVVPANDGTRPWAVLICPGYALGCCGDEITVPSRVLVDLADYVWRRPLDRSSSVASIGLRYAEEDARPVPSTTPGCGCAEPEYRASRLRDGYRVIVSWEAPDDSPSSSLDLCASESAPCPSCAGETGVPLAAITLPTTEGDPITVRHIDLTRLLPALHYSPLALRENVFVATGTSARAPSPLAVPIVGVIGGGSVDEATQRLATRIGDAVVRAGCILMTGGDPAGVGKGVKDLALRGAVAAARPDRPAGLIGIIPDGSRSVRLASRGPVHALAVVTGASNWERDVLTGFLPDVLIALPGEKGTLAELAYALRAGRPIVFVKSWKALKDELAAHPAHVRKVIAKLGEPEFGPTELARNLATLFASRKRRPATRILETATPAAAVKAALALRRANPVSTPRFPKLQRNPIRDLENELLQNLNRLVFALQKSSR